MKTLLLPFLFLSLGLFPSVSRAAWPVTDAVNLANNTRQHVATLAQWADSIARLRTQIDQLNQQINIQDDLRKWSGNPVEAGANVLLDVLGEEDLAQTYGKTRDEIVRITQSLDSLQNTADGSYRALRNVDIDGGSMAHDPLTFRRYSVLDAKQENAVQVMDETKTRTDELQEEIALTLVELKAATTDAEVQKLSAKLTVLNGQLEQVEATRRRQVDEVALQKIANDARIEQERLAAAELEAKDNHLANRRITSWMKTLKLRSELQ
ncbi:hypothetical protein Ga0100231_018920 [Opitutaceae bacterium TAV4]|nr:hypothetical protein Ga0100231_018920 [Opitutaceae bacterium TAV4]RRK00170.1 hypothetical protein Ga0100230_019585 [Opitutaceae bacterium TAV3]